MFALYDLFSQIKQTSNALLPIPNRRVLQKNHSFIIEVWFPCYSLFITTIIISIRIVFYLSRYHDVTQRARTIENGGVSLTEFLIKSETVLRWIIKKHDCTSSFPYNSKILTDVSCTTCEHDTLTLDTDQWQRSWRFYCSTAGNRLRLFAIDCLADQRVHLNPIENAPLFRGVFQNH